MKYNPNIHHRRSIRLKGYDYSQAGMYFVTICVQNREHFFGEIENGELLLNDAGQMVEKWCAELSHKFSDIIVDPYIVMSNHFHAIIVNNGNGNGIVGADLRVCPNNMPKCQKNTQNMRVYPDNTPNIRACPDETGVGEQPQWHTLGECGNDIGGKCGNSILGGCGDDILGEYCDDILDEYCDDILDEHDNNILGGHVGSPLRAVVQWFKTMTTNEYIRGVKTLGWQRFDKKLWQRNYWEHIIRNEQSYQRIANYILNNPAKWQNDKFYI